MELLDAQGTPFAAYRYDPWGNPEGSGNVGTGVWIQSTALIGETLATDIATRQPLRYAGYFYDSESGLYYLSARSYDPQTAQFLSKDPIDSDGEESPYQYCSGNPVSLIDPSGLLTLEGLFGGISAGFARLFDLASPLGGLVRGLERHLEKMSARASHIPGGRHTSLRELLAKGRAEAEWNLMVACLAAGDDYGAAEHVRNFMICVGIDLTSEVSLAVIEDYRRNGPQPGDPEGTLPLEASAVHGGGGNSDYHCWSHYWTEEYLNSKEAILGVAGAISAVSLAIGLAGFYTAPVVAAAVGTYLAAKWSVVVRGGILVSVKWRYWTPYVRAQVDYFTVYKLPPW